MAEPVTNQSGPVVTPTAGSTQEHFVCLQVSVTSLDAPGPLVGRCMFIVILQESGHLTPYLGTGT